MKNVIIVLDWFESEDEVQALLQKYGQFVLKIVDYKNNRIFEV